MPKKWHHVYSYSEIIQIYVYWTNCEFQKGLLWTQLLQLCPDSFETLPTSTLYLTFCEQICKNSMNLVHVKITADGDCSHEIRRLLLGRKVMTNLGSTFKSRDITLPTKVRLVKAMVFPVVMYGCESWIVKKAEHRRTDAFELWCWRRRLRAPWTARRSSRSILKQISPGCSLEGLMLKLKLQYFGPPHAKS